MPSFTARARLPLASVPATLSKGARTPRLPVSHGLPAHRRCAGSPAYADGYYAMSSAPQQPPQSTGFADSVQRAPTLLPSLPPAPLDRGFAASKLHHAEGASDDRQARLCWRTCGAAALTGVPHLRRVTSTLSSSFRSDARMRPRSSSPGTALAVLPSPRSRVRPPVARAKAVAHYAPGAAPSAAPTPAAAALACAMEKIAALQPRELALDRRLCHALEAMPREARFVPAALRVHRRALWRSRWLPLAADCARSNSWKRKRSVSPSCA